MVEKSVSELIIDKFSESIKKDSLFQGICDDFIALINQKKCSPKEIETILREKHNEIIEP